LREKRHEREDELYFRSFLEKRGMKEMEKEMYLTLKYFLRNLEKTT